MTDVLAAVIVAATFYFIVRGAQVRLALPAGVTVFDIAKRTAVPALSAAGLVVIILGFLG
jgi:hypothetical protein